jgi:hypothetical protein
MMPDDRVDSLGVLERYTIETHDRDECLAIVVRGPMPPGLEQVKLVPATDYDALAEQLRGAVEENERLKKRVVALEDLLGPRPPTKPRGSWIADALALHRPGEQL